MNNRIGDRFRDAYRDTRRWWEHERGRDDYGSERARGYEYDEGRDRRFGEPRYEEQRFGGRHEEHSFVPGRERQRDYMLDRDRDHDMERRDMERRDMDRREMDRRDRERWQEQSARPMMRQPGHGEWREDLDRDRWREAAQSTGAGYGGGMMVGPDPTGRYWYRSASPDTYDERYGSAMRDIGRFEGSSHQTIGQRMRDEHRRFPAGPKGYKRSDERIRDDLCDTLSQAHDIDASEVEVKVQSSEVVLTGTVPERHMKLRIEQLADRIPGVTDVNNQIRVRRMVSQTGQMGREQSIRPQSFGEESEGNGRRPGSPPRV